MVAIKRNLLAAVFIIFCQCSCLLHLINTVIRLLKFRPEKLQIASSISFQNVTINRSKVAFFESYRQLCVMFSPLFTRDKNTVKISLACCKLNVSEISRVTPYAFMGTNHVISSLIWQKHNRLFLCSTVFTF